MTKTDKQQQQETALAADLVSYARGGEPLNVELAAAPLIEDWFVVIVPTNAWHSLKIKGLWTHGEKPQLPFVSPPVIWFDRHHRFIRTATNLYQLGRQIGQKEAA